MAFDQQLAQRVRDAIGPDPQVSEKEMFGGLAFLRNGSLFCGILGPKLMVKVGSERYQETLELPNVGPMDFSGKPMTGFVFVEPEGCRSEDAVKVWVERGLASIS